MLLRSRAIDRLDSSDDDNEEDEEEEEEWNAENHADEDRADDHELRYRRRRRHRGGGGGGCAKEAIVRLAEVQRRMPEKSLKHLANVVIRSRHPLRPGGGGDLSYFVISEAFCKSVECTRRRIYDVSNVLEGIGMFARVEGIIRTYRILGHHGVQQLIERIQQHGVAALPSTYNRAARSPRKKTVKKKKNRAHCLPNHADQYQPPEWIRTANNNKEEEEDESRDRLKNMTRSMLYAMIKGLYPHETSWLKRDFVEWLATEYGGSPENKQYRAVHRRAYDILNVFEVVGLIRRNSYGLFQFCAEMPPEAEQVPGPPPPTMVMMIGGAASARDDDGFAVPEPPQKKARKRRAPKKKISVGPPRVSLYCDEVWKEQEPTLVELFSDPPFSPGRDKEDEDDCFFSSSSSSSSCPPPFPWINGEDGSTTSSSSNSIVLETHQQMLLVPFPWEELEIK